MSPEMQFFVDTLENGAADFLFGLLFLLLFAALLLIALFASLAIRAVWRFLTRRSWRDVVVSFERKALRSR
jgi:hypothetical protein